MVDKNKPSFSSAVFSSIVRSIRNFRLAHFPPDFTTNDEELESFQKHVATQFQELQFQELHNGSGKEQLSILWISKLLDAFVSCQEMFRDILLKRKGVLKNPRMARIASEYFNRKNVTGFDICNASHDEIEKIRVWQKRLEIIVSSLDPNKRAIGQAQFRSARKALVDLTLAMLVHKGAVWVSSHQNRHNAGRAPGQSFVRPPTMSSSWSAANRLKQFERHLFPPSRKDIAATDGIAITIYTMSSVLLFVLFALVAALPFQDRGLILKVHFSVPRQLPWSAPMLLLHEQIVEESKKQDRRHSNGLMKETYQIEESSRALKSMIDSAQFPLTDERKAEVNQRVQEAAQVCEALENGLEPLEYKLKQVFVKIEKFRNEALNMMERKNPLEQLAG